MSDSKAAARIPGHLIEPKLREIIARILRSENHEDLTVKRLRTAAESELDLPPGYLKEDSLWRERSKDFIQNEVEQQQAEPIDETPPKPAPKPAPRIKSEAVSAKASTAKKTQKRPSPTVAKAKPQKRRKIISDDEQEESSLSPPPQEESEPEDKLESSPEISKRNTSRLPDAEDESELSDVLDEPPPKKRKPKTVSAKSEKPSKLKAPKTKASKAKEPDDPNDAEIKRLQGWLIKCGIRKMWWKELQPYGTPKAKINHLKHMLKEAGMEGRFSVEKANKIKEAREMAADLEAVQEGAKRWGQTDSEDEGDGEDAEKKPRKRLARGFKDFAFLSDDGVETD